MDESWVVTLLCPVNAYHYGRNFADQAYLSWAGGVLVNFLIIGVLILGDELSRPFGEGLGGLRIYYFLNDACESAFRLIGSPALRSKKGATAEEESDDELEKLRAEMEMTAAQIRRERVESSLSPVEPESAESDEEQEVGKYALPVARTMINHD